MPDGEHANVAGERLLHRLSLALAREARADSIVRAAIDALVSEVGAAIAALYFVDEAAGVSRMAYSVNYPADVVLMLREIPMNVPAISNLALSTGEVQFITSRDDSPEAARFTHSLGERMGVQSAAAVPLMAAGHKVGVLVYGLAEAHVFESSELELLREVGTRIATALERDRLETQLARRAEEAELLHSIASAAAGEDDLTRILAAALDRLGNLLDFTGGSIALVEGDELVILAAAGPFAAIAAGQRLARGRGPLWRVIETGEPFLSNDLHADGLRSLSADAERATRVQSFLAVPLIWRGGPFGILEVDSTATNAFHAVDVPIVRAVGSILSGPIELARRYAAEVQLRHELDEAKGRLEAILAHAPMGVMFFDAQQRLAYANRAAHETLRVLPADEAPDGAAWDDLAARLVETRWAGEPDQLRDMVAQTQQPRTGIAVHDFPLRDPEQVFARISAPVFESGQFSGHVILMIDLSVERAALAQAEHAIALRDRFISIAGHELKTPLTSIKGSAQLLLRILELSDGAVDARMVRQLGTINSQSDRLRLLIDELLDVSRIQSGRMELRLEPADLRGLVRASIESLPDERRERVRLDAPAALPAQVDILRFEQVITNLLDNALKYSAEDTQVDVRLERDGEHALLGVTDRGIGVPRHEQPALFEPFARASNAEMLDDTGLGLGLYITRQIIELHGGTIDAESTPGAGSTFSVRLPLGRGDG